MIQRLTSEAVFSVAVVAMVAVMFSYELFVRVS